MFVKLRRTSRVDRASTGMIFKSRSKRLAVNRSVIRRRETVIYYCVNGHRASDAPNELDRSGHGIIVRSRDDRPIIHENGTAGFLVYFNINIGARTNAVQNEK